MLCVYRLSEGRITYILRTDQHIKLKLRWHHEENVQLTKRQYVHATTAINATATTTTITTTADTILPLLFLLLI